MTYEIKSLRVKIHDLSYGGYKLKYIAVVELPVADFKRLKGDLSYLVINLNNDLYDNHGIPAWNPSVDGTAKRASKGIKTLTFTYFSNDMDVAESLGVQMMKFKTGEVIPKFETYGGSLDILNKKVA